MKRKPQETYWNLVKDSHTFSNLKFEQVPDYKMKRVMPSDIAHSLPTLRIMAWLFSYHAAHSWQLQDLINYESSNAYRVISQIYQTGMLERSTSQLGGPHPHIYKISKTNRFNLWLDYLPYRAWLGVTAGQDRYRPSFSLRHNLAASDVALAAGKVNRIKAVVGETFATSKLMFANVDVNNRGDIVFVAENGLKIIIEITSTGGQKEFLSKIIAWGEVMLSTDDPFKVIFLDVAHPSQVKNNLWALSSAIKSLDRSHFKSLVTNDEVEMIKSRIGMNSFGRWLEEGQPTDDFEDLIAYRALDNKRQMEEFSAFDISHQPNPFARKILDNYNYLYAVPYELRMRNKDKEHYLLGQRRFKATDNPFGDKADRLPAPLELEDQEVDLNKRIEDLFNNVSNGLELGFPELDEF